MAHIIIGTAGHIDHGKSSLVKSLTGTDPDRLHEEQERGMTIDLGFAFLNDEIAFIDVPGHEKFIKNMVAGVSTVDMALLVIAADDGVMPQTREHLDILSLLNLTTGVIALTKIDMVDEEWLHLVEEDVKNLLRSTFLEKAPIFRVSSTTGVGIQELKEALVSLAGNTKGRSDRGVFWMPVDRSFTIKGFGTVVTGSVLSGTVQPGDNLELLPQKRSVKIRGVQTHGASVESAGIGDRAALNLANISKEEIERGNVLATPGYFEPSLIFDARLRLLKSAKKALKHRARIRLHVGTREILARIRPLEGDVIEPGEEAIVQLLLEEPAVAMKRDPFVIRQYSPPITIGGGIILDTNPGKRHKRLDKSVVERLRNLEKLDPRELLDAALIAAAKTPIKAQELARSTGLKDEQISILLKELRETGKAITFGSGTKESFFHSVNLNKLKDLLLKTLEDFHKKEPLRGGMSKAELSQQLKADPRVFEAALESLVALENVTVKQQLVRLSSFRITLTADDEKLAGSITSLLEENLFNTPSEKELAEKLNVQQTTVAKVVGALQGMEEIVRIEGNILFHPKAIEAAKETVRQLGSKGREFSVSEFREKLGTTRKYAMALLSHFDETGLTERVGEGRIVNE